MVMLQRTRIASGLSIPSAAGVLLWCVLFAHPAFGFREDLKIPLVAVLISSFASCCGGIIVALCSNKSLAIWAFLWFFVGVILLHLYGLLWILGVIASAFA